MAPSTARSRSWRPCTSEQTPILTEHHSGLLHLEVGLFRLKAVGHPRRPTCSLIARDDYARRSLPSATERSFRRTRGRPSGLAMAATYCPVGARLAGRRRAQIIRSAAADHEDFPGGQTWTGLPVLSSPAAIRIYARPQPCTAAASTERLRSAERQLEAGRCTSFDEAEPRCGRFTSTRSHPVSDSNAPVLSPTHAPSDRDEQVEVRERGRLSLVGAPITVSMISTRRRRSSPWRRDGG
jgi:hypothetical protein